MSTPAVVLIVEEDCSRREALRERLEGPHRVLEADRLKEVCSSGEPPPPLPDLILSDVRRTDQEALALARRLRVDPALEATPVLLLVPPEAKSDEADDSGGATPLLPESVGPQALRRVVGHHLAVEGLSPGPPLVPDAPFPEAVEAVVEARLSDPDFTVGTLADAVDLSGRQLTRRMKEEMGTTPAAYIRTRRLRRAEELLALGAETVRQVARQVGFGSPSAFSKAFREAVGEAPSTYAERHGE